MSVDMRARRLEERLMAARAQQRGGNTQQACAFYAEVLRDAPAHVEALDFLAMTELARGATAMAIRFLERARAAEPANPLIHAHLGTALRHAERFDEAEAVLRAALQMDPDDFVARIHLGATLEALGRSEAAMYTYFSAIATAQNVGRWRNDATTAPVLRPLLRHAMQVVDQGRARIFDNVIAPLREKFGHKELARVEHCVATYVGSIPVAYADDRQRPTLLFFPDLPAQPWFDRALFPWYEALEAKTDAIREELLSVLNAPAGVEPFLELQTEEQREAYLGGNAPQWNAFFFYRHGIRYEENAARCPRTVDALDAAPIVRIADHAPECLFSVLTPGSHILPHYGVTNTRLVTHLPLIVPENCVLRVGGEDHIWREGQCITFDDTFLHEAWNRSERTRVVMLMDVWNPYLTEVERLAISDIVVAISDFKRTAATI
jgi:aspartate beta-hydroxylase